jgi:hypothetical protein
MKTKKITVEKMKCKVLDCLREAEPIWELYCRLHQPSFIMDRIKAENESLKSMGILISEVKIKKRFRQKWPWYRRLFNRELKRAKTIFELIQEDKYNERLQCN